MQSVVTPKGTTLPLMNLKGKPYMQVAHRIVWFNEEVSSYSMTVNFHKLTEDEAIATAVIEIYDASGRVVKRAQGTKAENKKSFADFIEKAETGACGRAITMLGFGTAYAVADLDEGDRLIDSPVNTVAGLKGDVKKQAGTTSSSQLVNNTVKAAETSAVAPQAEPTKISGFRKKAAVTVSSPVISKEELEALPSANLWE